MSERPEDQFINWLKATLALTGLPVTVAGVDEKWRLAGSQRRYERATSFLIEFVRPDGQRYTFRVEVFQATERVTHSEHGTVIDGLILGRSEE